MNTDCIFCKIGNGDIESYTVYEDDFLKAFLDANPVSRGHTLIIPKQHYENVYDIPPDLLEGIIRVAKNLAQKYMISLAPTGINILHSSGGDAQQTVFHFHMHLVPRYKDDGITLGFHQYAKPEIDVKEVFEEIKPSL